MDQQNAQSKPFVTVSMVTLNREYVIGEALRSLASQDYPKDKLHVIIVDGGSRDRTVDICREMLSKAGLSSYEIIVKSSTIPEARNICLSRARGEYVFFWDSDVILPSCALARLVELAVEKRLDIISASVRFLTVSSPEEGWRELSESDCYGAGLTEVPAVTMSATLIARRVFEKIRFDEDLTLYEDLDFCWRARELGFRVFSHKGIVALDMNLERSCESDIFTSKPLRELMRGLRKKGRAKAFCLDFKPGLRAFARYLAQNPRHAFYLGYVPILLLLACSAMWHKVVPAIISIGYISSYAAFQMKKRGLSQGAKVLLASFLVGLPLNLFMLYYSLLWSLRRAKTR